MGETSAYSGNGRSDLEFLAWCLQPDGSCSIINNKGDPTHGSRQRPYRRVAHAHQHVGDPRRGAVPRRPSSAWPGFSPRPSPSRQAEVAVLWHHGKTLPFLARVLAEAKELSIQSKLPIAARSSATASRYWTTGSWIHEHMVEYEFVKEEDGESRRIWKMMGAAIAVDGKRRACCRSRASAAPSASRGPISRRPTSSGWRSWPRAWGRGCRRSSFSDQFYAVWAARQKMTFARGKPLKIRRACAITLALAVASRDSV